MIQAVLLFFLAATVQAQQQQIAVGNFCGMDNTDPANVLPDCYCQDCLNVEGSITGNSFKKRKGYTQQAALTIATSSVSGSLYYTDGNGNNVTVVCQDVNCSKSVNSSAFSAFVTTATPTPRFWSLVAGNGLAYGANDKQDKVWLLNNGTLSYSNTIPQCKILELTKDRMVCANTAANPMSVNYSKSGDLTTWTVGVNSVDPWQDVMQVPGQQINGLKVWNGSVYVFTDQSITDCQYGDQYTTACNVIVDNIGILDPTSVILTPSGIMFRGSDGNIWTIHSDDSLEVKSLRVKSLLTTGASGKQFVNTQKSQTDWQAGTQSPLKSWDTSTIAGSVFPSSITFVENSSTTFIKGSLVNVSTNVVGNVYIVRNGPTSFTNAGAETSQTGFNPTNWSMKPNGPTSWFQGANASYLASNCTNSPTPKFGTYSWLQEGSVMSGSVVTIKILDSTGVNLIASSTQNMTGSMGWTLNNVAIPNATSTTTYVTVEIYTPSNGVIGYDYAISSAIVSGNYIPIWFNVCTPPSSPGGLAVMFDIDETISQPITGTYTSQCYDTAYSTPTWGPWSVSISSPDASSGVTFQVQVASTCTGVFDAAVNVSSGSKMTSSQKEAIKYIANFTLNSSTNNPAGFSSASLPAATTGQLMTQCINTPGMTSSYGTLNCNQTLAGAGSIVFAATSTANCTTIPWVSSGTWNSVSNNTAPSISTGAATWIRFTSLLGSSTDQAQINSCSLNWINGTLAPPSWALYNPIDNSAYWSFSINQSTYNTRVLKYDLNLNAFYPFDFPANSLLLSNNSLYFGNSNGGYWQQFNVSGIDSDNGAAINAYFKSKDFSCGNSPFTDALWQYVSLIDVNESNGSLSSTLTLDRGASQTYSVNISTTSSIPYVRSNYSLQPMSAGSFANLKLGNNAANSPFEVMGFMVGCKQNAWRVLGPP